jgi:DNA-binding YbaB/EbfC family protein
MFDALKNLGNLRDLMSKAQEMQGRMKQLQDEMAKRTVQGDAGGGMVTATVNGRLEVTAIKIDK